MSQGFSLLALVGLLAGLSGFASVGEPADGVEAEQPPHSTDHVLVKVDSEADTLGLLQQSGEPVVGEWRTYPVQPGDTPEETVEALGGRPGVTDVELDYVVEIAQESAETQALPADDPYLPYQWHFAAVQVEDAWTQSTGDGAVIAVVDSGVSQDGEDLDCHTFVAPYNAITDSTGVPAVDDDNGHGTHIAGTLAQCTGNTIGTAGIAFDSSLMPIKVIDAQGSGFLSWVASGIDWARTHGADVINLSLGCQCAGGDLDFFDETLERAASEGIVLVAASGNDDHSSISYPANHPAVIAVGATDYGNSRAPYSNYGPALDLVAPGGDLGENLNGDAFLDGVLQESRFTCEGPEPCPPPSVSGGTGWGYYFLQGTSMATPHVAGAAALLKSVEPGLGGDAVSAILKASALDLGPPGRDNLHGDGLLQIADALAFLASPDGQRPQWPGGAELTVDDVTGDSLSLHWPEANDNKVVARYEVSLDGEVAVSTSQTEARIDGLQSHTRYRVQVRAVDLAGNRSEPLNTQVQTRDVRAPEWSNSATLRVTAFGEDQLTLQWSGASDGVGVTGYRLRVRGTAGLTTTARQATVTGLQPGQSYLFEVLARDAAGNWSEPHTASARTALSFRDTRENTFYQDILWLSGTGITRGCNPPANTDFCPDEPVTRAEMAAFVVRALRLSDGEHPGFGDVPASSTFAADIRRLANAGVTKGCNPPVNDSYCPDDPVTRGQMAAFLDRGLGLPASSHDWFGDDGVSTFEANINALANAGVTRGCNPPDNDEFCPEDLVTRGEMAAFLHRAEGWLGD